VIGQYLSNKLSQRAKEAHVAMHVGNEPVPHFLLGREDNPHYGACYGWINSARMSNAHAPPAANSPNY